MELSAVEWRGWRVRGEEGGKVKSGQGGEGRCEERRGEEKRGEEVYGLSPGILLH